MRVLVKMCRPATVALALALSAAHAQELRNWFNDPFFQVTSSVPRCPEPSGPRVTEAERQAQSHRRAEKGTTCWLAREAGCERPNAYAYDRDIAHEIQASVRGSALFANTTLWVTVQGRVVYVEGCVPEAVRAKDIEAFMRTRPHVQQAIALVTTNPNARPPYRTR